MFCHLCREMQRSSASSSAHSIKSQQQQRSMDAVRTSTKRLVGNMVQRPTPLMLSPGTMNRSSKCVVVIAMDEPLEFRFYCLSSYFFPLIFNPPSLDIQYQHPPSSTLSRKPCHLSATMHTQKNKYPFEIEPKLKVAIFAWSSRIGDPFRARACVCVCAACTNGSRMGASSFFKKIYITTKTVNARSRYSRTAAHGDALKS